MLSKQPLGAGPTVGPTQQLEYFPLHSVQPFRIMFDFVLNGKANQAGNISFKLFIGKRIYGPFTTTLETTFAIYNDRKRCNVPIRARRLTHQLLGIRYHLTETWASFDAKAKPITSRMILSRSRFKKVMGQKGPAYDVSCITSRSPQP